eukprot:scaffold5434_cov59-Phaeocystis_antarctica.AAC.2
MNDEQMMRHALGRPASSQGGAILEKVDRANGRRKFATQQPSLRDSTMSMARLRTADRVRRVRDVCAACDSCGLRLSLSLDRGRPTAAARGSSHRVRARYGFYIKM